VIKLKKQKGATLLVDFFTIFVKKRYTKLLVDLGAIDGKVHLRATNSRSLVKHTKYIPWKGTTFFSQKNTEEPINKKKYTCLTWRSFRFLSVCTIYTIVTRFLGSASH
jgi:hypothetical protein